MSNFHFTPEQQEVVDYIFEQIKLGKDGHNVVVSGRGGVGKTTMVCELICLLLEKRYRVACGAMTGKATGVLRQKIYDKLEEHGINTDEYTCNLKVETISKLTKKAQVVGITGTGETLYQNKWIDPRFFPFDVLIIDELSMVPQYIQQWWCRTSCRVIGLGDYCQIPEVHTSETAKEIAGFRHDLKLPQQKMITGYGVQVLKELSSFELKEVLRSTGDITLLCNELRDFSQSKEQIISTIKKWAEKSPDISYSESISDIEQGNDWQIIAYTNKMCKAINNSLAIGTDYPDEMDKVILHDNINPIQAYNGEVYIFKDLLQKIEDYKKKHGANLYVVWKFNGKMPNKLSNNMIEVGAYLNWMQYKIVSKDIHKQRLGQVYKAIDGMDFLTEERKQEFCDAVDSMRAQYPNEEECFNYMMERFEAADLDVAQNIMNNVTPLPQVFFVTIGLGYCCTTHKSQGSEYPKVCYILERMDRPLLYTGCSRAKEKLKVINLT